MLVSLCLMCNHSLKITTMAGSRKKKKKKILREEKNGSRTATSSARLKLERCRGRVCGESSLEGIAALKLDWLAGQAPLPGR